MKALVVLFAFLASSCAHAVHIHGPHTDIDSRKVVTITEEYNTALEEHVQRQIEATKDLPGPRVVIIYSGGGSVASGARIIKMLLDEKAHSHQPIVCAVTLAAHSMAFNTLTHCDVRVSMPRATMVVHKVAISGFPNGMRGTARNMRALASRMDQVDEYWSATNARAMHLPRDEYERYADTETRWTAKQLLAMHYLDDLVSIDLF